MIKQEELMLYDYYLTKHGNIMQILDVDDLADHAEFIPIEIDSELLKKIGFSEETKYGSQIYIGEKFIKDEHIHISLIGYNHQEHSLNIQCIKCVLGILGIDETTVINQQAINLFIQCKYLHELQHAFRLAQLKKLANNLL